MADEGFKRKLAAILSADVIGYSRLMRDDEEATVRDIAAHRVLISDIIQQHHGRVVDSPGDNILAEFTSVVDAVNGAIKIQAEIKRSNADTPADRRMEFRIGINLGDVIEEDERIYGDGVNIAARVEGLASAGGIAISGTVYEHIKDKLSLGYHYLGEQAVKNIPEPVRVYRLLTEPADAGKLIGVEKKALKGRWIETAAVIFFVVIGLIVYQFYVRRPAIEPASVENMAYPLPDKPSIAVLPFDNMSGDPDQEYFSDGITEEIITALSKTPKIFVIARNSTFSYKGKPVKVKQVAEELGVQYVLEGSVRKAEDRVRITAQLIDALTGHHLWSERYDRDLKDIFALQDEITMKIINALQVELTEGEHARLWGKGTDNLQAYLKSLRARELYLTSTQENNALARRLAEEAIALDPEYALPYHVLSVTHFHDILFRTTESPDQSEKLAIEFSQKAIALDDSYAMAHGFLGILYTYLMRDHEKGIMEAQKGVALDPNGAHGYLYLSLTLRYAGKFEEAIQANEKAIRLNPFPPVTYFRFACISYIGAGRYEEAIAAGKKAITMGPNDHMSHMMLAAAYSLAGRQDEANIEAKEVLRLNPKYSVAFWAKTLPYKNQDDREHLIGALLKAGLPEHPPLPLPDKPSIAVLSFDNLSGDPEQQYFSDGIAENIITALSKVGRLFVIARNSSFTYKGKPVKVQTVGRELGVKYVLEGSVRKAKEKVRITAQLIDAKTGHHLWAEKYDRDLREILALQDEITKEITAALQVKLTDGEQARIRAGGTDNLDAYLKALEARELYIRWNIEDNHKARRLLKEAIEIDPQYVYAYVVLGLTHVMDVHLGATKSKKESITKAVEFSKKALSIDNSSGYAHMLAGNVNYLTKQYEKGIQEYEKAVELIPNGADAYAFLARGLDLIGKTEEAILMSNKAMRLNPIPPNWYIVTRTAMYRNIKNYNEALIWAEKAVKRQPRNFFARINRCSVYSLTGRMEEARLEADEVMKLNPKFSLKRLENSIPYKNPEVKKRYIEALRKAGIPD
ncbi:MAG: tetratricopeptide repeat protein [Desulfobacterales bacterium]|jgi:adenylate cyclase